MHTTEYVIYDLNTDQFLESSKYIQNSGYVRKWSPDITKAKRWKQPQAIADGCENLTCCAVKVTTSVQLYVDHQS